MDKSKSGFVGTNKSAFTETSGSVFKDSFIPYIIKWGKSLNSLGIILCFGPCIALAVMGILPPWEALVTALAIQIPAVMSAYIYEPISYFAVLGIPGTYMSFLSGNISNLRVPASSVAQAAAGVEEGSEEGTIIATVGIAVSTYVNIAILTIGVVLGVAILAKLPPEVTIALNLLLPGLFAALLANYTMQKPKLAIFSIPLSLAMLLVNRNGLLSFLPGVLASALPILISVFGTMAIGVSMAKKGKLE